LEATYQLNYLSQTILCANHENVANKTYPESVFKQHKVHGMKGLRNKMLDEFCSQKD
jgi:hypothetical protein